MSLHAHRVSVSLVVVIFVSLSGAALAQIPNPTYANLYWESTGPFSHQGTWDADVTAEVGNPPYIDPQNMTTEMIDSYVTADLLSPWVIAG